MSETENVGGGGGSDVPEWLDEAFMEEVLSTEEGAPVKVHGLAVRRAVAKGENYASLLLRAAVDYSVARGGKSDGEEDKKKVSLIVKTLPRGEIMRGWIQERGVFPRERRMYEETLPALYALETELGGERRPPLATAPLRCARDDVIVLRDLCPDGFRMSSRRAGLDLPHARLALRNIARLHAGSVALHAKDPPAVEYYGEIFYTEEHREQMDKFVPVVLGNLATAMESWGGDDVSNAAHLRAFAKDAVTAGIQAVTPRETSLNVLNHGDCWVNNFLFRYDDDGALKDMRFVDFQVMRYGSPSLDLQYFLYTSVNADVREEHWNELLEEYVSAFGRELRALQCPEAESLFSPEQLQDEMDAHAAFGVISACTVLFAVMAEPSDVPDLDNLTQEQVDRGEMPFDKAFQSENYKTALRRLLPYFIKKGYL